MHSLPHRSHSLSLVTLLPARQAPSFALLLLVVAHPSVVHICSFSTAPLHTRRRYPRQGEELLRHQVCRPGGPKDDWARRLLCRERGHAQVYRSQVCHEVHQHVRQVQTKPAAVRAAHTVRIALHTRAEYVGWGQGRTHLPQPPNHLAASYVSDCAALVQFYGATYHEGTVAVTLEFMDLGGLDNVLAKFGPVPEKPLAAMAFQVPYHASSPPSLSAHRPTPAYRLLLLVSLCRCCGVLATCGMRSAYIVTSSHRTSWPTPRAR